MSEPRIWHKPQTPLLRQCPRTTYIFTFLQFISIQTPPSGRRSGNNRLKGEPLTALVALINYTAVAHQCQRKEIHMSNLKSYSFPVIYTYEPNQEIAVTFPDLNQSTSGINDHDADLSAKELLAITIQGMLEDGEQIPSPTPINRLSLQHNERAATIQIWI